MKKHIIYKHCHRPFPFKIVGLTKETDNIIKRTFVFTESCMYLLDDGDQYDWNKLYGVSLGLFGIHKNSVRFAWRYNPETCRIEIAAYWYINGNRCWKYLCSLTINKEYNFKITFFNDSVIFTVMDDLTPIGKYQLEMNPKIIEKERYQCGLYFGGNRRSPQRIEIIEHEYKFY